MRHVALAYARIAESYNTEADIDAALKAIGAEVG
jgi:hypothetical protein